MKNIWKVIAIIAVFIVLLAFSWAVTCGIVKLITVCFGLAFSWKIATGIWLICMLLTGGVRFQIKK